MPRDPRLLRRAFGDSARVPGFEAGTGPAIWLLLLIAAAVGSAIVSVVALIAATTPDATTAQLRAWGVLGEEERWLALHADGPDAESGCVLTRGELIRYEDRAVTARLPVDGATLSVARDADGMVAAVGDAEIRCPSDPGTDLDTFVAMVRERGEARRTDWRPPPDPRVRELIDGR